MGGGRGDGNGGGGGATEEKVGGGCEVVWVSQTEKKKVRFSVV